MDRVATVGLVSVLMGCSQSLVTMDDVREEYGIETSVLVHEIDGRTITSSHFYEGAQLIFVQSAESGEICHKANNVTQAMSLNCRGQAI